MTESCSIVLADNHEIPRAGIACLLRAEHGFEVAGEATDGATALALVDRHAPDVLIVESHLPGVDTIAVLDSLQERKARTAIVVLTNNKDRERALALLESGAMALVLKDMPVSHLIGAIRDAASGQVAFAPEFAEMLSYNGVDSSPGANLTSRERDVLNLIADGHSNSEVARTLRLSVKTVETHRTNMYRKLNVHSASELIMAAVREDLLDF